MLQKFKVKVLAKEKISDKVYQVTFGLIDPPTIDFKAGQNMMLLLGEGINRSMSIASPPSLNNQLLMVHDISPMGPGSKWTLGLKVGDEGEIMAPTGGALALIESSRRKVFVATGTGVAPFRSIILDSSSPAPIVLYWGLRYESDLYWQDELAKIKLTKPNFSYQIILSKPGDNWQGKMGHVTEHVFEEEKDLVNSDFYLCGNKEMIKEVKEKLLSQNVPIGQIKTELFY